MQKLYKITIKYQNIVHIDIIMLYIFKPYNSFMQRISLKLSEVIYVHIYLDIVSEVSSC